MSTRPSRPEALPDALAAPLEKLVFLYVRENGQTTVPELRDILDVPQLRLYPIITSMAHRGLVQQQGDDVWLPKNQVR